MAYYKRILLKEWSVPCYPFVCLFVTSFAPVYFYSALPLSSILSYHIAVSRTLVIIGSSWTIKSMSARLCREEVTHWLGRRDLNPRMQRSKRCAVNQLGDSPIYCDWRPQSRAILDRDFVDGSGAFHATYIASPFWLHIYYIIFFKENQ